MAIVAVPVSDALSVCVTSVFVAREVRKLRRLRAAEPQGVRAVERQRAVAAPHTEEA